MNVMIDQNGACSEVQASSCAFRSSEYKQLQLGLHVSYAQDIEFVAFVLHNCKAL